MTVNPIEGYKHTIRMGPVASLELKFAKSESGNDNNEYFNTIDNV